MGDLFPHDETSRLAQTQRSPSVDNVGSGASNADNESFVRKRRWSVTGKDKDSTQIPARAPQNQANDELSDMCLRLQHKLSNIDAKRSDTSCQDSSVLALSSTLSSPDLMNVPTGRKRLQFQQ